MSVKVLPEKNIQVLEFLKTYRFLTVPQMMRLGVAGHRENVYKITRRFKVDRKPLVQQVHFGFLPGYGRLPAVFHLTKYGAELLAEILQADISQIPYPKGAKLYQRDYFHRCNTVDFHIELRLWAEENNIRIECFDTYFESTGSNRSQRKAEIKTKVRYRDGHLIPDANFMLRLADGQKRLYTLEVYNGTDTKRTTKQIEKHLDALNEMAIGKKYNHKKTARIVCIFESENGLNAVLRKLNQSPEFKGFDGFFLFKTLKAVKEKFLPNWLSIDNKRYDFVSPNPT